MSFVVPARWAETVIQLEELLQQKEGLDLEVKKALGRDGDGELPHDFWATYSAMANTEGGTVLLGVREDKKGRFVALGLNKPEKVVKALWDNVNNKQQVSANLLQPHHVGIQETEDGKKIVVVDVPRATRQQRPVYVGQNMLTGTYRRGHEGDYRCSEDMVRRMLADAVDDTRDDTILEGYSLNDLEPESLRAFRNVLRSARPTHPYIGLDDKELLRRLGGWRRDRLTGAEGLTLAGLLMFGELRAILDTLPSYQLDYRERSDLTGRVRYDDRVTTDGEWSGNVFDFYWKVARKLTADLKVPFRLVDGHQRIDDTPVHEALREALVNALIHADYTGRGGIVIIKEPDGFSFRNPGELRLPLDQVLAGGTSDCRNRGLQMMFQMIGEGEKMGSGVSKILTAWKENLWRSPLLRSEPGESGGPAFTELKLPMVSLIPPETMTELRERFGEPFLALDETERLALATAALEGKVTHQRLKQLSNVHPRDITVRLQGLMRRRFLEPDGSLHPKGYRLPTAVPMRPLLRLFEELQPTEMNSHTKVTNSNTTEANSNIAVGNSHTTGSEEEAKLAELLARVRGKKRVQAELMEEAILLLCHGRFVTGREIGEALGRRGGSLQAHYFGPLVARGLLERKFEDQPNNPRQAYRAVEKGQ